jgi:hypothetical protein
LHFSELGISRRFCYGRLPIWRAGPVNCKMSNPVFARSTI